MSDYDDRGAYTPPSDRLAFDPRQPVRGGGPAPVTLVVSALALVGVVGGVFFLYRDGFRHRGEAPALVGAPVADVRSPAGPPADANAAPAGLVLDRTAASAPPAPAVAPPQPLPRVAAVAPPAAPSASPPVAAQPAPPPPQVATLAPEAAPNAAPAPPRKLVVAVVPAPVRRVALAAPSTPAEHPAARHASPITIASLTDDALAHHTGTTVRQTHDDQASRTRLAAAPNPIAPPASRHAIAVRIKGAQAAPASNAAANRSAAWVQIGAFSSQTLAEQGWRDVARIERDSMAGKGRAVQPIERDDGATLYRTYVTGFGSVTAARAFCAELRAAARACLVK